MNLENHSRGTGKTIAGYLLAIVTGIFSPLLMLSEMLSLMIISMLPAIAIVWLNRWSGRGPAFAAGISTLVFSSAYFGGTFMWMFFMATVMPAIVLIKNEKKAFFQQMKTAIASFGIGVVASVVILYLSFGANMIERTMGMLPDAIRALPAELIATLIENYSSVLGSELSVEAFYQAFNDAIERIIPLFQMYLPGLLFSGAILSAVFCVFINAYMLNKKGAASEGAWMPLKEWALPASTTWGLLMILAISYAMVMADFDRGENVFVAVQYIVISAFCVQAFASLARRTDKKEISRARRAFLVAGACGVCLAGGMNLVALYGGTSAVFGTKGALRQRMENIKKENSDDENRGGN